MNQQMKVSDKISLRIMEQMRGSSNDIMIPNFYCGIYEMDVFKLSGSGYVTEFEIKTSRSDFKADFLKPRKHDNLKAGNLICNRFYFVTPKGLLKKNEIPEYAGLIELDIHTSFGYLYTIKNAPLLHKNKYNGFDQLARSLSFRESNQRAKANYNLGTIKALNIKIENLQKRLYATNNGSTPTS